LTKVVFGESIGRIVQGRRPGPKVLAVSGGRDFCLCREKLAEKDLHLYVGGERFGATVRGQPVGTKGPLPHSRPSTLPPWEGGPVVALQFRRDRVIFVPGGSGKGAGGGVGLILF